MNALRVISPGFLTTVQDLGRFGYAHLGISAAGAGDALSLRLGNLLAGNPENTAALEMSLVGIEVEFEAEAVIALAGADMEAAVGGQTIPLWTTVKIKSGQVLKCGATSRGVRTYFCVQGGIDVPHVFGSAATHQLTGLGGFEGRPLRRGDSVPLKAPPSPGRFTALRLDTKMSAYLMPDDVLRVTSGPQASLFAGEAHEIFYSSVYEVSQESDRMGLRLQGPALPGNNAPREILTEGVSLGSVQITHLGEPIILFVDHQTTGGYPKIANVVSADIHRVGQRRPRDIATFEKVSLARAYELHREQESLIHEHPVIPA